MEYVTFLLIAKRKIYDQEGDRKIYLYKKFTKLRKILEIFT